MQPDYLHQPPAYFHTRILVGPGAILTPRFTHVRGITHVINCARPEDSPSWFRSKCPDNYVCLNALDSPDANILDWYPEFDRVLHSFLRAPMSGVVYVHCFAGMNRSGFLALAYVCSRFHMDGPTMLEAFQRQRPCLFQNQVYRGQVLSFINGCLSRAENPRQSIGGTSDGNTGLGSQGRGSDPARLDVDTGRAPE